MYRFLLSRSWVMLTLVALALIPAMVWLGFWQLDRHGQRVERNELIAASLAAPAVPMAELTSPGGVPAGADRFRPVTARGEYDASREVLARNRSSPDGALGYHVLTPLLREDGAAVLVNRGWVPAGDDLTRTPEVPAPPRGEVTVTGRLMRDETTAATGIRERTGLPDGMVMLISSRQQAEALDLPMLGGYLELTRTAPPPAGTAPPPAGSAPRPELLPAPDHTGIGAHFAYAVQWWLFAAGVPAGWVVLLRRELRDRRAAQTAGSAEGTGGRPEPGRAGTAAA